MGTPHKDRHFAGQTSVPKGACIFQGPERSALFAGDADDNGFSIDAYDGGVTKHWYWGNLAFDLDGLSFAAPRLPVLDSHSTRARLGFTTRNGKDGHVTFDGRFLANPDASQLREDMKAGFPMQASLSLRPSLVEQVADGAKTTVNGKTLKGPGAVFRQAVVDEVSMCVLGAMDNTRSTALADSESDTIAIQLTKETDMGTTTTNTELTVDSLKADHGDVYDTVFAAGRADAEAAAAERFAKLKTAAGDDAELCVEAFSQGWDVEKTLMERNARLQAKLAAAEKAAAQPQAAAAETVQDAATQEFVDQPAPSDTTETGPKTFMEAVQQYEAEHDVNEAEAVSKCVDLYPDLHTAMRKGQS